MYCSKRRQILCKRNISKMISKTVVKSFNEQQTDFSAFYILRKKPNLQTIFTCNEMFMDTEFNNQQGY